LNAVTDSDNALLFARSRRSIRQLRKEFAAAKRAKGQPLVNKATPCGVNAVAAVLHQIGVYSVSALRRLPLELHQLVAVMVTAHSGMYRLGALLKGDIRVACVRTLSHSNVVALDTNWVKLPTRGSYQTVHPLMRDARTPLCKFETATTYAAADMPSMRELTAGIVLATLQRRLRAAGFQDGDQLFSRGLRRSLRRKPMTKSSFMKWFRYHLAQAWPWLLERPDLLDGITGHAFRAGGCCDRLRAGHDAVIVQKQGNWQSLRTVLGYHRPTLHEMAGARVQAQQGFRYVAR